MQTWRQYTRPARFRAEQGYTSATPCCDTEVLARSAGQGGARTRRCPSCGDLWTVSFAVDDVGEHFAYWRRYERQQR